jgi:hypothetical protein
MIPIYFAAIDQVPKNGFIYASSWNRDVYKPLSLVLVFTTEVLATMTDFAVIYKVAYVASKNNQDRLERNLGKLTNGLVSHYLAIWTWVIVDAIIKLLIILGYPFLFDTMISIFSVALRAKCNMKYGLNLKDVLRPDQLSVKLQTVTKKMESSVVAIKSS